MPATSLQWSHGVAAVETWERFVKVTLGTGALQWSHGVAAVETARAAAPSAART